MTQTTLLAGKIALVTGGGRGIGKAIAYRLAEAGAQVVIASRKQEVLQATADEYQAPIGKIIPFACHIGKRDQIDALVHFVHHDIGPIDILVNNSATNLGQGPALDATDEMLDKIVEINIKGPLRLIRAIVPSMIERQQGGSIINIASIAGLMPQEGGLLYSFTKAGLLMMTRNWAREFGPHRIRVNAIAPGLIQTDFSAYFWEDPQTRELYQSRQCLPHLAQPQEVGGMALFLASDQASFITGQTFVVDGGYTA